jgi:Universal stress protein family
MNSVMKLGRPVRVSAGLAGRVIIEAAGESHAELIVVAAHPGRTALPGTVSQYVLLKARCPVTIVPGESTDEKTPLVGVAGGITGAALGAAGNLGIKGGDDPKAPTWQQPTA